MKVFIDADGCPVVNETVEICRKTGTQCIIICDTSHSIEKDGAQTIVVEKGSDSVDFRLVNMIGKGDVAVTQDYALAAMCLARGARIINQNGMEYTDKNIDSLLMSRFVAKKVRNAGGRLKGPSKRTKEQTEQFVKKLAEILQEEQSL